MGRATDARKCQSDRQPSEIRTSKNNGIIAALCEAGENNTVTMLFSFHTLIRFPSHAVSVAMLCPLWLLASKFAFVFTLVWYAAVVPSWMEKKSCVFVGSWTNAPLFLFRKNDVKARNLIVSMIVRKWQLRMYCAQGRLRVKSPVNNKKQDKIKIFLSRLNLAI